jgi:hypothetical protein
LGSGVTIILSGIAQKYVRKIPTRRTTSNLLFPVGSSAIGFCIY